jgi:hypothetical protein
MPNVVIYDNNAYVNFPHRFALYGNLATMERPKVNSSAYSNSPPKETPLAMVEIETPKGSNCLEI